LSIFFPGLLAKPGKVAETFLAGCRRCPAPPRSYYEIFEEGLYLLRPQVGTAVFEAQEDPGRPPSSLFPSIVDLVVLERYSVTLAALGLTYSLD
jgi:hypothetical protein